MEEDVNASGHCCIEYTVLTGVQTSCVYKGTLILFLHSVRQKNVRDKVHTQHVKHTENQDLLKVFLTCGFKTQKAAIHFNVS